MFYARLLMRAQRQLINAKETSIYYFNRIKIKSLFVCALDEFLIIWN